jgi:hypothetical protein
MPLKDGNQGRQHGMPLLARSGERDVHQQTLYVNSYSGIQATLHR